MLKKLLLLGVVTFSVSLHAFEIAKVDESDRAGIQQILEEDLGTYFVIVEDSIKTTLYDIFNNNEYTTVVIKEAGKVIGFLTYQSYVGPFTKFFELFTQEKARKLMYIAIARKHQGKGAARHLCDYVFSQLQKEKVNYVICAVIRENMKARTIYEKSGFFITFPGLHLHQHTEEIVEALKKRPQLYYRLQL